jgi:hypothetical protein
MADLTLQTRIELRSEVREFRHERGRPSRNMATV